MFSFVLAVIRQLHTCIATDPAFFDGRRKYDVALSPPTAYKDFGHIVRWTTTGKICERVWLVGDNEKKTIYKTGELLCFTNLPRIRRYTLIFTKFDLEAYLPHVVIYSHNFISTSEWGFVSVTGQISLFPIGKRDRR